MADTGFVSPTETEVGAAWTDPDNAHASDDSHATENSVGDKVEYKTFGFSIPSDASISGIEVTVEAHRDTSSVTVEVDMSWDGGTSFSNSKDAEVTNASPDSTYTLGADGDTWGRTWSPAEFSDANFRIRMNYKTGSDTVNVDHIQVKVYYSPSAPPATVMMTMVY